MVQCALEKRVFLYDTYVKYGSAIKCQRKFRSKFRDERVCSRQTIHNLVNKLRQETKTVFTQGKLDDVGARLEHTHRKSLKCPAQETGVSKSSARSTTQLLKLRPYTTTAIHALQPCNPASRVHFCSPFLQSVVEG
jgi:hypothetical protein